MDLGPEEIAVARALAAYLRANPLACDSADGIRLWWLGSAEVSMETLVRVLAWMTRRGLMEELVAADGRLRFRRIGTDAQLQCLVDRLGQGPSVH